MLSMLLDDTDRIYLLTESREIRCYRLLLDESGKIPVLTEESPLETERPVSDMVLAGNMLVINYGKTLETVDLRTRERLSIETGLPQIGRIAYRNGSLFSRIETETDSSVTICIRGVPSPSMRFLPERQCFRSMPDLRRSFG